MKKVLKSVGLVLACLLLVTCVSGFLIVNSYLSKIRFDPGIRAPILERSPSPDIPTERPDKETASAVDSPKADSSGAEIVTLENRIMENLKSSSAPLLYDGDVFNVLLIGIDTREDSDTGNSDSMILISVNRKTSHIVATSLLRDIYLKIPGLAQGNRLNAAYAYGGPVLLLKTIRENFKIRVDKYVTLNFFSFMKVIDQIGGLSFEISSEELWIENFYIREINRLEGMPSDDGCLTEPGMQHFNGKQALGFARIRYVGNCDFGRTDRQRMIMNLVFNKLRTLNLSQLDEFLNVLLPEIRTNLEKGEIVSLLLSLPKYAGFSVDSWYVPMDGTYSFLIIRGLDVLGIDFNQNITELQKKIYGSG